MGWRIWTLKSSRNLKIGSMWRTNPPAERISDGIPWDKTADKQFKNKTKRERNVRQQAKLKTVLIKM